MTQSGQGEEPSARPAREGIVLPSDGGEPLLPGMTTGPVAPGGRADGHNPGGGYPASAPSGGQTWGTPWGPGQQDAAPPPSGQGGWQTAQPSQPPSDGQWGAPETPAWGAQSQGGQGPGPLPPEGAQQGAGYGGDGYGTGYGAHGAPDAYGLYGGGTAGAPPPPAHDGTYGAQNGYGAPQYPPAAAPDGTEGVTQYMPPVPAPGGDEGATQFIPPVPAPGGDEGATQLIPPVGPGALPPEVPAHGSDAGGYPGAAPHSAGHPDAEATQFIAPVTDQPPAQPYGVPDAGDGNRQPPAEFDNLFRNDNGGAAGTQQMPRVDHVPPGRAAYTPPGPPAPPAGPTGGRGGGRGGGRTGSRVPLIAAVGVGIVVFGVGAGALIGSGGGDDEGGDNQNVSATSPATEDTSASPAADPARAQAVELDKLLADSGDSRTTVINAVADVKSCNNLGQAAADLREAAGQRTQLVTDLSGLSVDKLPDHEALTTALTKAWQASASADNHYAAWADQTAGKKGCKKGQARSTGQTQAGNQASGTATVQKQKAADLWNAIAKQYGLTERQPTQL
ncbi:hypothetical protein [Streptomyces edwardsiae]|uniref:Uncharacterized protein n=1 Tax=Streptomyces edwardsiae TaxID=3075527 RepID=A0ABU2PYU5_9ACTN|nr:hypothetical protein [Streptomyces sp. DSM 41636]MDT0397328.1 hypothetical protein [Streptomyces sp. DSM 41636]